MVQRWNTISNGHIVEADECSIVNYEDYALATESEADDE